MPEISVSILDLDFTNIEKSLNELYEVGVRRLHLDIIDTTFAENISFGPNILNNILNNDNFKYDLHFMIKTPFIILEKLNMKNVTHVFIHICSITNSSDAYKTIDKYVKVLSKNDVELGIAINPNEDITMLHKIGLKNIKCLLIMMVYPGFGGQKLIMNCVNKIIEAKKEKYFVAVDGGINLDNIRNTNEADIVVVGSALTRSNNLKECFNILKEKLYK